MTRRQYVLVMALAGAVCMLAGCASGTKTAARSKPLEPATSTTSLSSTSLSTTSLSTTTTGPTITSPPPASVPGESTTVAPPRAVTTTTTIAPVNPIVRAPVDGAIQITAADHNSTFAVALGEKVELTLSSAELQFMEVHVTPSGLLQVDPAPAPPVYGQLVIWTAAERGTVTVTSAESAVCGPPVDAACPMFVLLWTVKLVIS